MLFTRNMLILAVLVVAASFYGFHRYEMWRFEKAYSAYEIFANKHVEAALIPALAGNPLRQDLNKALSDVLADNKSPAERLARAKEGESLLVLAEGNIDAIGEIGKDVADALYTLEGESNHLGLLNARNDARAIVDTASKRGDIIADIRGLSYNANYHTQQIFDRIIADNGELTKEHVVALNELIPSVEEQFDKRSNLYNEMQDLTRKIEGARNSFDASW